MVVSGVRTGGQRGRRLPHTSLSSGPIANRHRSGKTGRDSPRGELVSLNGPCVRWRDLQPGFARASGLERERPLCAGSGHGRARRRSRRSGNTEGQLGQIPDVETTEVIRAATVRERKTEPRSCHDGASPRRMKMRAGCHGLAAQRSGHAVLLEPEAFRTTPITPLRSVLGRATRVYFHRRMKIEAGCHGLAAQRSGHASSSSLGPFEPRPSLRSAPFWDVPPVSIFTGDTETQRRPGEPGA